MKKNNERTVKVQLNHGEWTPTNFSDIPKGLYFKLYEEDGECVGTFAALSEPYLNDNQIWEIQTDELEQ